MYETPFSGLKYIHWMKSIIGTCLNVKKPQNRTILVISRSWEFKSSTTTSDYGQLKESLKKIEVPRNENHQDKKKDSESSEGGSSSDFRLGSDHSRLIFMQHEVGRTGSRSNLCDLKHVRKTLIWCYWPRWLSYILRIGES